MSEPRCRGGSTCELYATGKLDPSPTDLGRGTKGTNVTRLHVAAPGNPQLHFRATARGAAVGLRESLGMLSAGHSSVARIYILRHQSLAQRADSILHVQAKSYGTITPCQLYKRYMSHDLTDASWSMQSHLCSLGMPSWP